MTENNTLAERLTSNETDQKASLRLPCGRAERHFER